MGIGTSKDHIRLYIGIKRAADQGDVRAEYSLGLLYTGQESGNYSGPEHKAAFYWFSEAGQSKVLCQSRNLFSLLLS